MSLFSSVREARDIGTPLLRLHRATIGRDPDESGFAHLVAAWQRNEDLLELAHLLLATAEARDLHGDTPADAAADHDFVARAASCAAGHAQTGQPGPDNALVGLPRAEVLVALAHYPHPREPAVLPALFADVAPDDAVAYRFWCEHFEPARPPPAVSNLVVHVVMSVGDAGVEGAIRSVASLRAQTHRQWNLVIIARLYAPWGRSALGQLASDARVGIRHADALVGQNGATAIPVGDNSLRCLLDAGDCLAADALAHVAAAFTANPRLRLLYTDEDCADLSGARSLPRFKTTYSLDAMLAGNMMGQLTVYRSNLLRQLGGPDASKAPYQAYDLALRAALAVGPDAIGHLSAVLCHRAEPATDWPVPLPRLARSAPGLSVENAARWPRIRATMPTPPTVSIIMPTRDGAALLRAASTGVLEGTNYPSLELLIVDNGTTDPAALGLLAELAEHPYVRILPWPGPFNFSAMNNHAARQATGEVLLLLNNDVEIHDPSWLREMVAHAIRSDVGAVGARLLHADGSLQHGGIVLGPAGRATHVLRGAAKDDPGYMGQLACTRDVSAVTGACLAIRRDVWRQVGGMDETLPIAWNDIDLCQRVRAAGLRIVWTPHAILTHLEGSTRGNDAADATRLAAFEADRARYRARWGRAADEDPFLSPNLVATDTRLCLAAPRSAHG